MQTDKIIYNALVARKSKKDFQKELRKSGLLGTYRSEVLFFKTCGHLKIPHICYENNYHKRISEKLVLKENIMLFLNIFLFILAACIFTESLLNVDKYPIYELIIVPLSCIIVMGINLRLIARASGEKEHYFDVFHANLVTILDYVDLTTADEIKDEDLLKFLRDIKDTKIALAIARKAGFLMKDSDLELYIQEHHEHEEQLAVWDDESSSSSLTSKDKAA